MAKKKLFKSKTNFTLKRLHQSGSYGSIYERDYTTIANTGTVPEGQIPIYNSPSFKLSVRAGYNGQKKYNYGGWLTNPSHCGPKAGDVAYYTWDEGTIECINKENYHSSLGIAIGVVLNASNETPDGKVRIISLQKEQTGGVKWCKTIDSSKNITGIPDKIDLSSALLDMDGMSNTDSIISNTVSGDYAAHLAKSYNCGIENSLIEWYLPSAGELFLLLKDIDTINNTLSALSGETIDFTTYSMWSSTEKDASNVYFIKTGSNEITYDVKSSSWAFVRPFTTIIPKDVAKHWTLGCMPEPNKKDTKIILKPNVNKITDFACFGSASELIKATLTDIVSRFPAELFSTTEKFNNEYIIDNPMAIDLIQGTIPEDSVFSPLRYFCTSWSKYNIDSTPITNWNVVGSKDKECLQNGDLIATITLNTTQIKCYYYGDSVLYTMPSSGVHIKPNDEEISKFFESLDDFEKILLNQYTDYTAKFETYIENEETGWVVTEKEYRWPKAIGGWNLAVKGVEYNNYVNDLSELAIAHDELFTDAIWRTMTHEAISNMDLTLTRNDDDIEVPNSSKMKQALSIIGRQFDEIKKYADGIKTTNNITYSQNGNTPDYFLPSNLELAGWETKEIFNDVSNDIITDKMYGARTIGFSASDANNEFMRRLSLNSKQILSQKGTKKAIEDLMAIFGYHSVDWLNRYNSINSGVLSNNDYKKAFLLIEHVYVTTGYAYGKDGDTVVNRVKELNTLKDSFNDENINNDNIPIDYYQGIPVTEATVGEIKRLIPWFDKDATYDGKLYFQMKGGWSRNDGETDGKILEPSIYERTVSKIHYLETIDDLSDLSLARIDVNGLYYIGSEKKYYKVKDINQHQNLTNGWQEPTQDEILEAENIIDNNKGNNPHSGEYDGGVAYYEPYGNIFMHSSFNGARNENLTDVNELGFDVSIQADSTKCLFLLNTNQPATNPLRGDNKISPYNLFTNKPDDFSEEAALSIINSKEFHIIFDKTHRDFIEKDILPYIKQLIPSTTIFSYSFETLSEDVNKQYEARVKQIICNGNLSCVAGIAY